MTPAQKKNVARFKAAAAEAKKIRAKDPKLTQAEAVKKAFAKLYGVKKTATKKAVAKKTVAKKKPARKKVGEYHKDQKSHNVNIRVVSGVKKRVGALPVGFTGKFLGWPFKVLNQFTLDGGVTAQIVELDPPGKIIAELDGRKEDVERAYTKIFQKIAIPYAALNVSYNKPAYVKQDQKRVENAVRQFLTQLNKEVSEYNSGKDRKTKTAKPAVIKYTAKVKKLAVVDQIKSILAANTQRLKNGYTLVKGKPRIKENAMGSIKRDAVQSLKKMTDTLSAVMAEKAATKTKAAGMSAGAKKVTAAHLRDLSANERALKKRISELKRVI
jgi:hypothetical protein